MSPVDRRSARPKLCIKTIKYFHFFLLSVFSIIFLSFVPALFHLLYFFVFPLFLSLLSYSFFFIFLPYILSFLRSFFLIFLCIVFLPLAFLHSFAFFGGDDVDEGIDVDDETRDEECSLLKKSISVSRTFVLADLQSTELEPFYLLSWCHAYDLFSLLYFSIQFISAYLIVLYIYQSASTSMRLVFPISLWIIPAQSLSWCLHVVKFNHSEPSAQFHSSWMYSVL